MRKQANHNVRRNDKSRVNRSAGDVREVNDVPEVDAEIEVRFEYKDRMVWWLGIMETSMRNGARSEFLGRGNVIYSAMGEHEREREHLRFLPGGKVKLSGKEGKVTSWRLKQSAEEEQDKDKDFEIKETRPTKKVRTEQNRTLSSHKSAAAGNEEYESANDMVDIAIDSLATRMTKLERFLQAKTTCNHADIINHCVNVKRTAFRRLLGKKLSQVQRTWKRTSTPFQEAVRSDVEEITITDDLQFFHYLVDDARARSHNTGCNRVVVRPHWVDVKRTIRCTSADVIFSSITALMEWLDITCTEKIRDFCTKEWKEKGVAHMRVVGSIRWSENSTSDPLQLFCGKSIGPIESSGDASDGEKCANSEAEDAEKTDIVEWESATWDLENNCMQHRPVGKTGNIGVLTRAGDRSVIAISWRADDQMSATKHDGIVVDPTDVVLGTITLQVPVVYFRGNQICSDVRKLLKTLE